MTAQKRMRHERPSPSLEKKKVKQVWRKKTHYSHFDKSGHQRATFWRLHRVQRLMDKASMHESIETIVRKEKVSQRDDPFALISERWFF